MRVSDRSGWLDYVVLDQWLIDGIGRVTRRVGKAGRLLQNGRVQNYLMWAIAGAMLVFLVSGSV